MKQEHKKTKVKGSVLITVTMVMFIMVMFLMSTLVLTRSANRRSYYTYFETQAQFAAQAALDAVTNNAYHSSDFSDYVKGLGATNGSFKVYFDNTNIPLKEATDKDGKDHKFVTCNIQKLEEKNYVWDSKSGQLCAQDGWKLSAVAEVGYGENTSKYTVVNYIYSNVRDDEESVSIPKNAWDYEYMLSIENHPGGTEEVDEPNIVEDEKITEEGCVSLSEMGSDNQDSMGKASVGFFQFPDGRTKYRTKVRALKNDGVCTGEMRIINSTELTGSFQHFALDKGCGFVIMGDLDTQNYFWAWSNVPSSAITSYKEIPYVYVDDIMPGKTVGIGYMGVENKATTSVVGYNGKNYDSVKSGTVTSPVNLYAGAWYESEKRDGTQAPQVNGDMYLHDPALTSQMYGNNGNKMVQFVENNIKKLNGKAGYVGGDMICNNKTLRLNLTMGNLEIGGDFLFTNPDGVIEISGDGTNEGQIKHFRIGGTAVIRAKEIRISKWVSIDAEGGLFIDPNTKVVDQTDGGPGRLYSDGQILREGSGSVSMSKLQAATEGKSVTYVDDGTEKDDEQSATHARIENLGITVDAEDFTELCTKIMNSRNGYPSDYTTKLGTGTDYSLYPFAQRVDEIWEEYVRWDIYGSDGKPGFASAKAAEDYYNEVIAGTKTDNWLLESYAAGHTYKAVAKTGEAGNDGDTNEANNWHGTRYFLACTPYKTENSFIRKIETFDREEIKTSLAYQDSYAKLKAAYGTINEEFSPSEQDVLVYSHTKDGTPDPKTIKDAQVVNESCKLCVDGGKKYFIDPTANNHSVENPLVIALYTKDNTWDDHGRIEIIVNNSAVYEVKKSGVDSLKDYEKPFPYGCEENTYQSNRNGTKLVDDSKCMDEEYEAAKHASRADVIIYFMGGDDPNSFSFEGNTTELFIYPSGAYSQMQDNSTYGDISYLVDCPFPDGNKKNNWNNTTPKEDKFKFEMLPNVIFFAHSGLTCDIGAGMLWGAWIGPTSTIASKTSSSAPKAKVEYRLNTKSEKITFDYKACCWVGSIIAEKVDFDNWRNMVFGGDVPKYNGGGTKKLIPKDETYSTSEGKADAESLGQNMGKFFDNDHMAQG